MAGALTKRQTETRNKLLSLRPGATPAEYRAHLHELCQLNDYDPVMELLTIVKKSGVEIESAMRKIAETLREDTVSRDKRSLLSDELMKLATIVGAAGTKPSEIIGIHKEVLQYIAPKLRSLDISGQIDSDINLTIKTFGSDEQGNVIDINEEVKDGNTG